MMGRGVLRREVTRKECPWLNEDLPKDRVVYRYIGSLSGGWISQGGVAVTDRPPSDNPDEDSFYRVPIGVVEWAEDQLFDKKKIKAALMAKQEVNQEGRVVSAAIYLCKEGGRITRDNTCVDEPYATYKADNVLQAFTDFRETNWRSRLVLALDNGREISIMPVLRKDVVAFNEKDFDPNKKKFANPWNVLMEVWPR